MYWQCHVNVFKQKRNVQENLDEINKHIYTYFYLVTTIIEDNPQWVFFYTVLQCVTPLLSVSILMCVYTLLYYIFNIEVLIRVHCMHCIVKIWKFSQIVWHFVILYWYEFVQMTISFFSVARITRQFIINWISETYSNHGGRKKLSFDVYRQTKCFLCIFLLSVSFCFHFKLTERSSHFGDFTPLSCPTPTDHSSIAHAAATQQMMAAACAGMRPPDLSTGVAGGSNNPATKDIKVTLEGRELWQKFHEIGTEMIITKAGRWAILWHLYT